MSLADECRAVEYHILGTGGDHEEVRIVLRRGFAEEQPRFPAPMQLVDRWAVVMRGYVLDTDGEWEWEPTPSSRDDDFRRRTRFASPEEALEAYKRRKP